jgi:ribA/ribD-fused uncharacterized protein
MQDIIDRFTGLYDFLSNFYMCPVPYVRNDDGHGPLSEPTYYRSVEHIYQALKAMNNEDFERIAKCNTAGDAKRMGRTVHIRKDWEDIKVDVMRKLVMAKFSHNLDLWGRLRATGNAIIIEGNWWGDKFWGIHNGEGENWLGKILMEVRNVR